MAPRVSILVGLVVAGSLVAGCGTRSIGVATDDPNHAGAKIFVEHCGACHTLGIAGTHGSTTDVTDREREDGPNFDDRKENVQDVLFAIENGGFSGAIMPENIITGPEAQKVAQFLAKYAGKGASTDTPKKPGTPAATTGP